jgi:hypothetical protein
MQFLIKKRQIFFHLNFSPFLVIKNPDPDPAPDPNNQHCSLVSGGKNPDEDEKTYPSFLLGRLQE